MSWFSDANCAAASLLEHVVIGYAVDFDFTSGHVRMWTGIGDLSISSNIYTGVGGLGSISGGAEKTQLVADRRTYSLAYVDPTTVPESEIDASFGRSVTEYEVWIDPETRLVIGTEINWEGRMSKISRKDGNVPLIEVACETRLVNLEDADGWRYTSEHQAKFFAGDTGFDQVKEIESVEIIWGGFRVVPGGPIPNLVHRVIGR
jgi:hypothetical protein